MKKILLTTTLLSIVTSQLLAVDFIKGNYYGGVGFGIEKFSSTHLMTQVLILF